MTAKQCITWDLTLKRLKTDGTEVLPEFIGQRLKKVFKKFVFQPEKGSEKGAQHYQFRGALFKKTYKSPLLKLLCESLECELCDAPHVSPTVGENTKNFNYVMKLDTRDGDKTYLDTDFIQEELAKPAYVPIQYRGLNDCLYPYQKYIFDNSKKVTRHINVIYDPKGNNGKSTVAALGQLFHGGFMCPPINDRKELVQCVCDVSMDLNKRQLSPIFIDMPRAMNQREMAGLYSGIEQIKSGMLTDTRHHFKCWEIDSPEVWVFCNTLPNLKFVSPDRWKIWKINDNHELIPYVSKPEVIPKTKFFEDDDEDDLEHTQANLSNLLKEAKRLRAKLTLAHQNEFTEI